MERLLVKGESADLPPAGLRVSPLLLRELPPLLALERLRPAVAPALQPGELALELAVALQALGGERSRADGSAHRASRLGLVGAVVEAAGRCQRGYVLERLSDSTVRLAPELELAQSRRVDHEAAARDDDQLPMGGRVPPAAVALPDLPRLQLLSAEHAVDQR